MSAREALHTVLHTVEGYGDLVQGLDRPPELMDGMLATAMADLEGIPPAIYDERHHRFDN